MCRRVASLRSGGDSAYGAEGCGFPQSGNAYKVSVMGLAFCVIWHDKHSGNWLTAFATPPIRLCHWTRLRREGSEGSEGSKGGGGALRAQSSYMAPNLAGGQPTTDSEQPTADSGHPPANACYPAKGTPKGISIQNTHASMTWFSKSAAGVIVEGAGRKDVSFPIISFEEAYYGELQSL